MNEAERVKAVEEIQFELFKLERVRLRLLGQIQLFKNTGTKVCRRCRQERSVKMFYTDTRYKDDHYPWCKLCKNEAVKTRYRRMANASNAA